MVDRQIYFEALAGTLESADQGNRSSWEFFNRTCMPVLLYWVTKHGAHAGLNPEEERFEEGYPGVLVSGENSFGSVDVEDGNYFIALSLTGGLAGVFKKDESSWAGELTCADFMDPGDVGPIPEPNVDRPVPMDSPRVVVGCGKVPSGNLVVREEFWRLTSDSYSLGPDEERAVSYTQITGMESTTSVQDTLAESVGVSASAGWGPVSASVSASLSGTTTTFQQVTLSSQQTTFVSRTLTASQEPRTVLYWQLTDVLTVLDAEMVPVASAITAFQPVLNRSYDPRRLPAPRRRGRMTAEEREWAPRRVL